MRQINVGSILILWIGIAGIMIIFLLGLNVLLSFDGLVMTMFFLSFLCGILTLITYIIIGEYKKS